MPQIGANFQFTSRQPNFERDQFDTIAHMAACTVCDEGHKCYCLENQKTYEFTSVDSNGDAIEPNETTGYWHEFSSGGSGDVTGATIGSGASEQNVTKVGNILKFPAYPTVPITGIKDANGNDLTPVGGKVTLPAAATAPITKIRVYGENNDLPIDEGRVVIPSPPVKGIQTSNGDDLSPNGSGIVTLPTIPADPTTRLNNAEKRIAALESELGGDPTPVVIPVSAVNLPHTAGSTFTYDPDDTYVMNISDVQIATVCYPYDHTSGNTTTSYLIFKAIDRDLYYVYTHNLSTNLCTYFEEKVFDELSHEEAKAVFEAGKYAVKQVINNDGTLREGYWKHGVPSVFVSRHGYPLRYRQIHEEVIDANDNGYHILIKHDEINKIFKYRCYTSIPSSSPTIRTNRWYLDNVYVKNDASTGENYTKYDAYFDRQPANNVSFDDSVTHLSTPGAPVNNVQDAIEMIVSQVTGTTGILTVNLQYSNTTGIANKKCKIVVYYQGVVYKPNTFPVDDEFTTDSNGNIILNLPLGSTYTITPIDIVDYVTPEDISGIVDDNYITKTLIYNAVSNNERILFVVNIKNVSPQITVNNKKLYIDIYDPEDLTQVLTEKAYTCTLGNNGTPKLIEDYLGNTIATGNTLYFEIPKGTKLKAYLQTWDGTDSLTQEYIKSSDVIITANKNKDIITFYYSNVNYGLYLLLKDSTKEKGYSKNKILEVDSTNNRFTCNIGGYNYIIYKENSKVYRILEGTSEPEEWLSNTTEAQIMLGVGICSSQTNTIEAKDDNTVEQGFLTLDFFVPRIVQYERGVLVNGTTMPIFDNSDGMYITRRMSEYNETVKSVIAQNVINNYKITLYQGNDEFIIPGFIPSSLQFTQFIANYTAVLIVTNIFSGTPITKPISIATYTYIATSNSYRNSTTMTSVDTYDVNLNGMNSWSEINQNHQFYIFYPFA